MAAKSSQEIAHFTARVIPRASAFALQGYKHCCHVMLHCPTEARLFSYYPIKHAVLVSVHVLLNNIIVVDKPGRAGLTHVCLKGLNPSIYCHFIE